MESNRFWQQLDICSPDKLTFPITVIGAGAIGSTTVLTLTKMGYSNVTVYEEDVVSEHITLPVVGQNLDKGAGFW